MMKEKSYNKISTKVIIAFVFVILLFISVGSGVNAKYLHSKQPQSTSARVAKCEFDVISLSGAGDMELTEEANEASYRFKITSDWETKRKLKISLASKQKLKDYVTVTLAKGTETVNLTNNEAVQGTTYIYSKEYTIPTGALDQEYTLKVKARDDVSESIDIKARTVINMRQVN